METKEKLIKILDNRYEPNMHWKKFNRINVLNGMLEAYELGLSQRDKDVKEKAIEFAEWIKENCSVERGGYCSPAGYLYFWEDGIDELKSFIELYILFITPKQNKHE